MVKPGASYQPELIELMKTALDEATNTLPVATQTSDMKLKLASRILSAAARGVRDPIQLRIAALTDIEEVEDENNVYRCYAQLQRLRQQVEEAEATRSNVGVGRNERLSALRDADLFPSTQRMRHSTASNRLVTYWNELDRDELNP
jgi:hypothetical protein